MILKGMKVGLVPTWLQEYEKEAKGMSHRDDSIIYIQNEPIRVREKFVLSFPIHKRIWRLLMLIIKGWCYFD